MLARQLRGIEWKRGCYDLVYTIVINNNDF